MPGIITDLNDPRVFPHFPMQDYLSQKSPTFPPTIIRRSVSNREVRASFGDYPIWQFKVALEGVRDKPGASEIQRLYAFFCNSYGQFKEFYYYDPYDNAVSAQPFGAGDGVTAAFQIFREVGPDSPQPFAEPVYVLYGTPIVTINGTPTTDFTISGYGTITFGTAPGNTDVLAWSGSFMFLCRFAADQIDAAQMVKRIFSFQGIPFTSWLPL